MNHYSQLTQEQRYHIYGLQKARNSQTCIADLVGVHKSTISREVRRNEGIDRSKRINVRWISASMLKNILNLYQN